jgi:hypothetical protein
VLRLKKLLATLVATLLVTAGASAVTATPAAAAGVCPSGYACFYEHVGYTGSETDYYWGFRGSCVTFYGFWHDRISSFQNNIGASMTLYRNANCNANQGSWGIPNGFNVGDMGAWGWNDTVDSVYFH